MLQDRLGLSERRACQIAGQHRSTQRHQPGRSPDDGALRGCLRAIPAARGGLVPEPQAEAAALARGGAARAAAAPAKRLVAECPNQVWALDFQFDQTVDGRGLKLLHVVDEFTREALAIRCQRRIDADATVAVLDRLVAARGRLPEYVRCDNGPELTANALRDWCRFNRAGSAYIEPGSPWQNAYVQSFGSRVRYELLGVELFDSLAEAQLLVEDWRHDYNTNRPHSALGMIAPARFAASWRRNGSTDNQLSSAVDR